MMYPRLYLARNLLREDGVIFISIDENEMERLRWLCNEVFGEGNLVGQLTILCNPKGRAQDKHFATNHEYVLVFSKNQLPKGSFNIEKDLEQIEAEYTEWDEAGKFRTLELRNTHIEFGKHNRKNLFYSLFVDPDTGEVQTTYFDKAVEVLPIWDDKFEGCWTWGKPKATDDIEFLVGKKVNGCWKIYVKDYANGASKMLKTILVDKTFFTERGQKSFNKLFNSKKKIFQSPKSNALLSQLLKTSTNESDIVLDFFAGSATTAHAVFDLNSEDGENRKFILVQLPEPCSKDSEAFKAGYENIADIGKERIRKVIKKIEEEKTAKKKSKDELFDDQKETKEIDLGFKVFKLDKSNFQVWDGSNPEVPEEELKKQLELHIDHIDPSANQEDTLYELLLKAGFMPTVEIEKLNFPEKTVFSIANGELLICLEDEITKELIDAVANVEPLQFLCLDKGFQGNDQLKANAVQTFAARNQDREKSDQIIFRTV